MVKHLFSYYISPESLKIVNQSIAISFASAYQNFLDKNTSYDFTLLASFRAFDSFMRSSMTMEVPELGLFKQTAMFVSLVRSESFKFDIKRGQLMKQFNLNSNRLGDIAHKVNAVLAQTKSLLKHDASLPITKGSDQPFGFDTLIEVKIVINTFLGMANESRTLSKETNALVENIFEPFLTLISTLLIFSEVGVSPEQMTKVAAPKPDSLDEPHPISTQLKDLQTYLLQYCLTDPKRSLVVSAMAEFHSKLLENDMYIPIEEET